MEARIHFWQPDLLVPRYLFPILYFVLDRPGGGPPANAEFVATVYIPTPIAVVIKTIAIIVVAFLQSIYDLNNINESVPKLLV